MSKKVTPIIDSAELGAQRHQLTEDILGFIEAGVDADLPSFNLL